MNKMEFHSAIKKNKTTLTKPHMHTKKLGSQSPGYLQAPVSTCSFLCVSAEGAYYIPSIDEAPSVSAGSGEPAALRRERQCIKPAYTGKTGVGLI